MKYILSLIFCIFLIYEVSLNIEEPTSKVTKLKPPVMDIQYEKQMAFDYLNTLRQNAGMPYYFKSKLLDDAAQSHALYLVSNHANGHFESPDRKNFTGKTPRKRIFYANYKAAKVTENVTTNISNYKASIDGLFSAIYHRFGFLDFQSDEIGIGIAQDLKDTEKNAFVYDMGIYELNDLCTKKSYSGGAKYVYHICKDPNHHVEKKLFYKALRFKKSKIKKIVIYPYDGQKDVPPAFYGENPDPLPNLDVSGFPISIQFNDYYLKKVKLLSFTLYDGVGNKVKNLILSKENDPNQRFKKAQYALFPLKRLLFNTKYKVSVKYLLNGKKYENRWHFFTRKPEHKLFKIKGNSGSITIKSKTTYTLYFKPLNPHDTLKTIHFPKGVNAKFIDPNTINLTVFSTSVKNFKLTSGKKALHVKVTE